MTERVPGEWTPRLRDWLVRGFDQLPALGYLAFFLPPLLWSLGQDVVDARRGWLAAALTLACGLLLLLLRRRRPVTVLAAVFALCAIRGLLVDMPDPLGIAIALHAATARLPLPRALAAMSATLAGVMGLSALAPAFGASSQARLLVVDLVTVCVAGLWGLLVNVREHRRRMDLEQARRADEERLRALELGLARDRAAMSRDVHDLVGHTLTAVVNLSDGALAALEGDPSLAAEGLRRINGIAREGLAETRSVLVALQEPEQRAAAVGPAAHPDRIPELLAPVRGAGIEAELLVHGEQAACQLEGEALAAAYRIAQEAVTNVLRHAREVKRLEIELDWCSEGLALRVRDDGVATTPAAPGLGITSMTRRAELAGGRCTAGPFPDGGWLVAVWLPARSSGAESGA